MNSPNPPFCVALAIISLAVSISTARAELPFSDPFTADAKVPERRALRAEWQIADGVAKCTQDDALYKKFKDHGPIIFYDLPTTDATIRYAMKPQGCKSAVFTLNSDEGHVFRFVTSERGTSIRAFPPGDEKSIETHRAAEWVLKDNAWTSVAVTVEGKRVTVTFGEFPPVTVEHESYAKARSNLSVGFAFGSMEIKDVSVTK